MPRRYRKHSEVVTQVTEFCHTPKKQTEIMRACRLDTRKFKQLVESKVITLHKVENNGRGSYNGIHYWKTKENFQRDRA